jgi:hypothetical protein
MTLEYGEVQAEISAVAFSVAGRGPEEEFAWLVNQFEATAAALLARVAEGIEDASYEEFLRDACWRHELLYLADELASFPWLLVNVACPAKYETLQRLYREWAQCCSDLRHSLKDLAATEHFLSIELRVAYADEELAAVTAHTTARKIFLEHLAA